MTREEYEAERSKCNNTLGDILVCQKYIKSLESQNASLIQQVNECGVKYEKLVGVIDMALSDVDDGGYVRAGARLRKWKMDNGGQDV